LGVLHNEFDALLVRASFFLLGGEPFRQACATHAVVEVAGCTKGVPTFWYALGVSYFFLAIIM
jgi:hypothetical protein